ncbi:MAG: universal stress protein [Acidobacteriia bacterium]|nr:universal stress protein [Terriglobia bacterium]
MPSFKHILFPVDFSAQVRGIAPYAVAMSRRTGAQVTLLHVVEVPTGAYPGWPADAALISLQDMLRTRQQCVDTFLQNEFREVAVTRVMREGDPARGIIEYAEDEKADLIMMPTHGYGPFRRFLLGSVTAKVLHDVKCPVWTGAHVPQSPAPPSSYRNVLCAVDLTDKSLPLLQWASAFAYENGANVTLLHAVASTEPRAAIDIEGERFRAYLFDTAREELAKIQRAAGTNWETVLEGGDVAHAVRNAAEQHHADLVVIGRGVLHELFGRMRTHVYSVIREAPCPVMSV